MSLANNINDKLDEILNLRAEINRMKKDLNKNEPLVNIKTGKKATKKEALVLVEEVINQIKDDINKLTDHGRNIRDIFTNDYYVNDLMEEPVLIEEC